MVTILSVSGYMIAQNTSMVASHTFVVDGDLPIPTEKKELRSGEEIAKSWAEHEHTGRVVAKSWGDKSLYQAGKWKKYRIGRREECRDTVVYESGTSLFYNCMVEAYAGHYSVILSPDAIWTLISQGFCHHISLNTEKLKDKIVNHEGKMEISVISEYDLYSPHMDWDTLLNGFEIQIAENTKGNIADIMRADFSTTGNTERITSQVTLMSAVKSYFDFAAIHTICGIPTITIEGTPDDWRKIIKKVESLRNYDLGWWVDDLKPILQEFVNASEGNVNKDFWQNIVKKDRPESMKNGAGCGVKDATKFDGWFLKFMPFDKDGRTPDAVVYGRNDMLPSVVSAPFTYIVKDATGNIISKTPMEIMSGFVGIDVNENTYTMRPHIGWMVSEKNNKGIAEKIQNSMEIIRVDRIPEELKEIEHLEDLTLEFTNDIVIPEWMDTVKIDYLTLKGNITPELVENLKKRFYDKEVNVHETNVTISVKE
ncbi:MAG: DUF4419 domain-containing protein [Prevotella sp.]|nr:DUF4419 domain-containing protein [Prevotella sp.]